MTSLGKGQLANVAMEATVSRQAPPHEAESAIAWADQCRVAAQFLTAKRTTLISEQTRALLIETQILGYAQRQGRLPTMKELQDNVWDHRTMTREEFRNIARSVLEHLRPGQDSPGDQSRHDIGDQQRSGPRRTEVVGPRDDLAKPAGTGYVAPAPEPSEPLRLAGETTEQVIERLKAALLNLR